ncbi:MAG: winged helix DNA-binding protein [Cellvibrionaceae bacterium]
MPLKNSKNVNKEDSANTDSVFIVSSDQLLSEKSVELSEFEYGMIIAWNAFSRWLVRCMSAAGYSELTPTDVLVLHHLNHRLTEKKLADICFVLNIEDTHIVSYSLKKLMTAKLVKNKKQGKEAFFYLTEEGCKLCEKYRAIRESCLMGGFSGKDTENEQFRELASALRGLSGHYDQAARAASAL